MIRRGELSKMSFTSLETMTNPIRFSLIPLLHAGILLVPHHCRPAICPVDGF